MIFKKYRIWVLLLLFAGTGCGSREISPYDNPYSPLYKMNRIGWISPEYGLAYDAPSHSDRDSEEKRENAPEFPPPPPPDGKKPPPPKGKKPNKKPDRQPDETPDPPPLPPPPKEI